MWRARKSWGKSIHSPFRQEWTRHDLFGEFFSCQLCRSDWKDTWKKNILLNRNRFRLERASYTTKTLSCELSKNSTKLFCRFLSPFARLWLTKEKGFSFHNKIRKVCLSVDFNSFSGVRRKMSCETKFLTEYCICVCAAFLRVFFCRC